MKLIKLLDLENEVRRLAEEKPDFIYRAPQFGLGDDSCF